MDPLIIDRLAANSLLCTLQRSTVSSYQDIRYEELKEACLEENIFLLQYYISIILLLWPIT